MTSPLVRRILPPLLVIALGLVAYARCIQAPFIFDDTAIRQDTHIQRLWPLTAALAAPKDSPLAGRPVVAYSMAINYALGGYDPRGYHVVNLLIHLLCGLVLFGVIRAVLLTPALSGRFGLAATGLATVVACAWVVHPLASEPVVYVLQRTESVASLFYLLTLWCALRAWSSDARPRRMWTCAAVMACALGMGSKENMFSAPLVVLLADRTLVSESFRAALARHWRLYLGLAATWLIMAFLYASAPRGRSVGLSDPALPPVDYLCTQAGVLVWYLRLCFWPRPLSIIYDWPIVRSWVAAAPYGLVVLALVGVTGWAVWRRWAAGVAGAVFFLVLAPSSSWVPMLTEIAAERRMYLPLAAVVSVVVIGAYAAMQWVGQGSTLPPAQGARIAPRATRAPGSFWQGRTLPYAPAGLAAAMIVLLTVATAGRVSEYRTAERIWRSALTAYPNSLRGLGNLGAVLVSEGRDDDAMVVFRRMLAIAPDRFDARIALGNCLFRRGRLAQAAPYYRQALIQNPTAAQAPDARLSLAECLLQTGQVMQAKVEVEALVALRPANAAAHEVLGLCLAQGGDVRAAEAELQRAAELAPQDAGIRANLDGVTRALGRGNDAQQHDHAAGPSAEAASP